jgi:hypothetical protein
VGLWENPTTGRTYPRLQILTLAELFQGKRPNIPLMELNSGKRAKREDMNTGKQGSLLRPLRQSPSAPATSPFARANGEGRCSLPVAEQWGGGPRAAWWRGSFA